jgi:hypothetical protein
MLRHSVVIDHQGFQTVDQQSKRRPRAGTCHWFDDEERPSRQQFYFYPPALALTFVDRASLTAHAMAWRFYLTGAFQC